jgi:hypothetical protein
MRKVLSYIAHGRPALRLWVDAEGGGEGHPLGLAVAGRRQARVDDVHELSFSYDGAGQHHEALLALGPAGAHRLPPGDELEEDNAERVHVYLVADLAVQEVLRSQVPATMKQETKRIRNRDPTFVRSVAVST